MAELQHYAIWDEALELVGTVAQTHGLRLVPEVPVLAEPKLAVFDRMGPAVAALLAKYSVVQLEGPFTKFPLAFDKRKSGSAAGTYSVSDSVGPRLRWFLPGMRGVELTPGSITMIDHYKNPETNQFGPPSDELRAAYKAIVATLKEHLAKYTVRAGETVWVGKKTKGELENGNVTLKR
jgi:hypothetical protein